MLECSLAKDKQMICSETGLLKGSCKQSCTVVSASGKPSSEHSSFNSSLAVALHG